MKGKRSVLKVTIRLDGVPGWGHDAQDHVKLLQGLLNGSIPHYKPTVELERVEESDE